MKRWVLAAGLLAAAVAPQALAADLDDGEQPPPPSWKAPSWKDGAYGYPPKSITPPPGYYDEDDDGPPYAKKYPYGYGPKYKNYGDDDDGPPPYKKYSDLPPHKGSCVRSEQVRDRLTGAGWRDFHAGKALSQTTVTLRARRPSGRLFELRLDRCSGEILQARALDGPLRPYYGYKQPDRPPSWGPYGYGPYAYGPPRYLGPYAYGRPYGYGKRPPSWDWNDDD
jgi:hypothetical protein